MHCVYETMVLKLGKHCMEVFCWIGRSCCHMNLMGVCLVDIVLFLGFVGELLMLERRGCICRKTEKGGVIHES